MGQNQTATGKHFPVKNRVFYPDNYCFASMIPLSIYIYSFLRSLSHFKIPIYRFSLCAVPAVQNLFNHHPGAGFISVICSG